MSCALFFWCIMEAPPSWGKGKEGNGQGGNVGDQARWRGVRGIIEKRGANQSVCCAGRGNSSDTRRRRISDWVL